MLKFLYIGIGNNNAGIICTDSTAPKGTPEGNSHPYDCKRSHYQTRRIKRNPYWSSNKPSHKVILNGYSHIKGLATELQSVLPSDYKDLSVLKPEFGSEVLSESFKETFQ